MDEQHPFSFSDAALSEATSLRESIAALNDLPIVRGITLDPPGAQDLDDAFWVTRQPTGGYLLHLSIANVASFIDPLETPALDQEAFLRGRTMYITNKADRPMLPTMLSEDCLSLREGQVRPAFTMTLPFDAQFRPGEFQIEQTQVLNVRRCMYEEADTARVQPRTEVDEMLNLAYTVARKFLQQRTHDRKSEENTVADEQYASHSIPHAFALLVNQTLADFLAKRGVPALYRSHPRENLVFKDGAITPSLQSSSVVAHTLARASTLAHASYVASIEPHSKLGLPVYMHITSPLRRYADLVNQRILLAVLAGRSFPYSQAELQILADHLNTREQQIQEEEQQAWVKEQERFVAQFFAVSDAGELQKALENLDAKTFHDILEVMMGKPDLPFPLEQDIIRRIEQRLLPPFDLFGCLFRSPHGQEAWHRIKIAGMESLQQQPNRAMTLLSLGRQVLSWNEPMYKERYTGPDNARVFWASAELLLAGQVFASDSHTARQRNRAKQLSILDLLTRIAGVDESSISADTQKDAVLAPVPPAPTGALDNPVAFLNELKQKRLIHTIDYVHQELGPPHKRTFSCQCRIILADTQQVEGAGSGKTKKDAANSAASRALEAIARLREEHEHNSE